MNTETNEQESVVPFPSELTYFAPSERDDAAALREMSERLEALPLLRPMLEAFPTMALLLSGKRQILMSNRLFDEAVPHSDDDLFLGKRFGDCIGCEVAAESPAGCGTGQACRMCGAVLAMLEAGEGRQSLRECSISIAGEDGPQALEYRVFAVPMRLADQDVILLSLVDISDELRRHALERIFFHDVLNTASGVRSVADLFRIVTGEEREELIDDLDGLADQLIEEILTQRDIISAERGDLHVLDTDISTRDILDHISALYRYHQLARERTLKIVNNAAEMTFITDPTLLARVLGNLTKNALEASVAGDTVTIGCETDGDDSIRFTVHNPAVMSEDVQLRMFRRSFSTKGAGRGLGTYSARLLTEKFLNGRIGFVSSAGEGTTFHVTFPLKREKVSSPKLEE
ncbi:MAG: histidine kinase [Bacteroidetes bacterium]|nr:histidine kinase [Bacteroidota bacterium]